MEKEVQVYQNREGEEPFTEWLDSFRDKVIQYRIRARIKRIKCGNFGDHKRIHGIIELRLDFGKGYRIYCGEEDDYLVILLVGGDKSSQDKDINQALANWRDYHEQKEV